MYIPKFAFILDAFRILTFIIPLLFPSCDVISLQQLSPTVVQVTGISATGAGLPTTPVFVLILIV